MKVVENTQQKNVLIDKSMYTRSELKEMLSNGTLFFINKYNEISHDEFEIFDWERIDLRISLSMCSKIDVAYFDSIGSYAAYVICKVNDKSKCLFINL